MYSKMRTSQSQFNTLVGFMEVNGDLSVGHGLAWRKLKQWEKVASVLNKDCANGDPKSTMKWRKVWSDLKNNTKKKLFRLANAKKAGQVTSSKLLTSLEKRVLCVMTDTKTLLRVMKDVDKSDVSPEIVQKRWADIRSRRKKLVELLEAESTEIDKVNPASSSQELSVSTEPFLSVKHEETWEYPEESDEDMDNDLEAPDVPQGMTSPAAESTSSFTGMANEPYESRPLQDNQGPKQDNMGQDKEELHKLQVAERVWVLKTLREQHATAQLEREKAQIEREKAQFEREKAELEREKAQFERDAAQMLRDKAQIELNRTMQENETNTFYNK